MLPVPIYQQPALLAAYLLDPKTRGPLAFSIGLGVASSIAAGIAVERITPEPDATERIVSSAVLGLVISIGSVLFLANRAEWMRQGRGGTAWLA